MSTPSPTGRSAEAVSRRRKSRRALPLTTDALDSQGAMFALTIRNLSETGLLIETTAAIRVGDHIAIDLPHAGRTGARAIWTSEGLFGCQFDEPVSPATLSAVQLRGSAGAAPHDQHGDDFQPDEFAVRLQKLRIRRGLSQSDLAVAMNVSAPAISGWEKGRARPKEGRIQALADILQVPLGELLGETEVGGIQALIDRSRGEIAHAVGTTVDKVRIVIEF